MSWASRPPNGADNTPLPAKSLATLRVIVENSMTAWPLTL